MRFLVLFAMTLAAAPAFAEKAERYSDKEIAVFVRLCRASPPSDFDRCIKGFLTTKELAQKAALIDAQRQEKYIPWRGAYCHPDEHKVRRCTID